MSDPSKDFDEIVPVPDPDESTAPIADTLDELAFTVEDASDRAAATVDDLQADAAVTVTEEAMTPVIDAGTAGVETIEPVIEAVTPIETLTSDVGLALPAEPVAAIDEEIVPAVAAAAFSEASAVIEETVSPVVPEVPKLAATTDTVPPLPVPAVATAAATATTAVEASSDDRLISALNWLGLLLLQLPLVSIVMLLADGNKNRPFQRHHALHAIGFWFGAIVYEVVAAIIFTIGSVITFGLGALCLWVIFFLPHLLALVYAWQAYQGKELNIPIVTRIMKQQGWLA